MKKTFLTIIMIITLVMELLVLTGCQNIEVQNSSEDIRDVNNTSTTENKYKGYTNKEWEDKIREFYEEYENVNISKITCQYDEEKNYIATITFQKRRN